MEGVSRRTALGIAAAGVAMGGRDPIAFDPPPRPDEQGQGRPKTFNIAFEGGGIEGAAFAGAIEVLSERGYRFRRLVGTSAGAITATLLAAGYGPTQLLRLLSPPDGTPNPFRTFLEPPRPHGHKAPNGVEPSAWNELRRRMGIEPEEGEKPKDGILHRGLRSLKDRFGKPLEYERRFAAFLETGAFAGDENFLGWMRDRLTEAGPEAVKGRGIDPDITLADFSALTGPRGVQLSLVAADVSAQRLLVLNNLTAPRVPLVQAVRMSMGIPLVWPEVEWQEEWGTYRGEPMVEDGEGHRVVDGGVLSNFPLRFLRDPIHLKDGGVLGRFGDGPEGRALGVYLDERLLAPGSRPREEKKRLRDKVIAYQSVSRLIATMRGAADREYIDNSADYICRIGVQGFDTLEFDMSPARLALLVESGRAAMKGYLDGAKALP